MMNVLLLGSSGNLGRFIVKSLLKHYDNIVLILTDKLDNDSIINSGKDIRLYRGDLTDPNTLLKILSKENVSHVVHSAAVWNGFNQDYKVIINNSMITINLLNSISNDIKKVIYISSSGVYDGSSKYENTLLRCPKHSYGMSKIFSENLIKYRSAQYGFKYTIWRPFHIVAPYEVYKKGTSHITTNIAYNIIENKSPSFINECTQSEKIIPFTWVEDVSECIVKNMCINDTDNQIFNIGVNKLHSVNDLVNEVINCAVKYNLLPKNYKKNTSEIDNNVKTTNWFEKLNIVLGWKLESNIQRIIDKFISYRYI